MGGKFPKKSYQRQSSEKGRKRYTFFSRFHFRALHGKPFLIEEVILV